MSKMCSLSKVMRSTNGESYVNLMSNPKFYCKRCGRVANEKEYLCRPFPLVEESANDIKIKEVEIAVTRDGLHKHYVVEQNEENTGAENNNVNETNFDESEEHQCDCSPEDNCEDDCKCKEDKVIHVSDLFKNEDGTYNDEWVVEEDTPTDEVPVKNEFDGDPFIKSLQYSDKKDKKIKKLRMSDLRNIIREEVRKALEKR